MGGSQNRTNSSSQRGILFYFFTVRVVNLCNKLSREVVDYPSLDVRSRPDAFLEAVL